MKRCPKCNRAEDDDSLAFCRADGTRLVNDGSFVSEGAGTLRFGSAPITGETETSVLPTGEGLSRPTAPTTVLDGGRVSGNTQELSKPKSRKGLLIAVAAIIAVTVAASAYFYLSRVKTGAAKNSIAVLPFQNAGGDPNTEYLSDGISESLINSLSQLPDVRVLARSTMFRFKGQDADPQAVGKQLGVDTVLTGRVVQVGDSLSVQADLVNVADGTQLWGERYSRKASDIIAVQEDIAREIAGKLRLRLSGEERGRLTRRYTENIEAYQAYLRGRYEWNKRTGEGLTKAIGHFNQAIQIDPAYALAYAGIADSYALLPQYGNAPFEQSLARAQAAAQRAIELDSSLAEAHVSLAYVKASLWDWDGVEEGYRRGLSLNPNYATGHQWYSEYLAHVGRLGEAEREIRLAQQLDPLSLIINTRVGMTLYFARRYDEAIAQLREALQFDPDFLLSHIFLFQSLSQQGMNREAIPHYVKGFFNGHPPEERAKIESALQAAYAASGERGMMEKLLDILRQQKKQDYSYPLADTLTRLGDKDKAFVWLNRAADVKHPALGGIKVEPRLDPLRPDPRFADLMRKVGLPQ